MSSNFSSRLQWSVGLLLIVVVGVGCGGGGTETDAGDGTATDNPASGEDLVACDLMAATEVEQWIGGPVVAAAMDSPSGPSDQGCSYSNDADGKTVLLTVYFGEKYYAGVDSAAAIDPVVIEGLGDDAYLDNSAVRYLSGAWAVGVSSIAGGIDDATLEEIARAIEPRLP